MVTLTQAQIGANDPTFNPSGTGVGASYNIVYTSAIQSDGKIIIGGDFTSYNGTSRNCIARLNTDGTLDAFFNPGTGAQGNVYTISIQSDGKIIIGGGFTYYNGTSRNRIARLNTDGTLDTTFDPGTGIGTGINSIRTVKIQSDGKIIIGGDFNVYNGTLRQRIARLNTDGTLDNTFYIGINLFMSSTSVIYSSAIQNDGKIIIGGAFNLSTSNGTTVRTNIARLNTDGTLDNTFLPYITNIVRTVTIQSDSKIIVGGDFTNIAKYIARLNTDGTLDNTFVTTGTGLGSTLSDVIYTSVIQSDGKIIIGGTFTYYNVTIRNRIVRLNTNGTLDSTFDPGTGANNTVYTSAIQSDGKIIIGGSFTNYDGTARGKVARINISGVVSIKETVKDKVDHVTVTGDKFKSDTDWTMYDISGRTIMNGGPGTYSLKNTGLYIISTKYGAQKYFKN
ncbi:MAG: delta-60 repeat domain-containing protein [Bacteroidetes bacterium]|nr:delta-60 repeat domain-containing protein [Bacteroidota bacterium]